MYPAKVYLSDLHRMVDFGLQRQLDDGAWTLPPSTGSRAEARSRGRRADAHIPRAGAHISTGAVSRYLRRQQRKCGIVPTLHTLLTPLPRTRCATPRLTFGCAVSLIEMQALIEAPLRDEPQASQRASTCARDDNHEFASLTWRHTHEPQRASSARLAVGCHHPRRLLAIGTIDVDE